MSTSSGGAHVTYICIFCGDQIRPVSHSTVRCRCGEIEVYDHTIMAQGVLRAPPS